MHTENWKAGTALVLAILVFGAGTGRAASIASALTPEQTRVITGTTVQAILDIARARREIHEKEISAAKTSLFDARGLFEVIRAELPSANLWNRIAIAQEHLAFDEPRNVLPDLVPIYSELALVNDVSKSGQGREHLDKARLALQTGNRKAAQTELDAVKNLVAYHEIDVPLSHTDSLLSKAGDLIQAKKTGDADKTLAQAEQSLQAEVVAAINASPAPRKAE